MANEHSTVASRARIDARIASLMHSVRALKEERNTFSDTASLPTELLMLIFTHLAHEISRDRLSPTGILAVSHVCRHWRSVALQCQVLWSFVSLNHSTLSANVFYSRAGDAPITAWVILDPYIDYVQRFIRKALLEHIMPKLSSFTLIYDLKHAYPWSTLKELMEDMSLPAPNLETLVVNVSPSLFSSTHTIESFFSEQYPSLRDLRLSGCEWNWTSSLFPASLSRISLRGYINPWDDAMYHALRGMPQLQILELDAVSEPGSWTETVFYQTIPQCDSPVSLPRLRYFRLAGDPAPCGLLLHHLALPSETSVSLCCEYNSPLLGRPLQLPEPEFPPLEDLFKVDMSWVCERYGRKRRPGDPVVRSLSLETEASYEIRRGSVRIRIWPEAVPLIDRAHERCAHPLLDLELVWKLSPNQGHLYTYEVLGPALASLNLTAVSTFLVYQSEPFSKFPDPAVFQELEHMSEVETLLVFTPTAGESVLYLLTAPSKAISDGVPGEYPLREVNVAAPKPSHNDVFFPKLRTIALHDIDFEHEDHRPKTISFTSQSLPRPGSVPAVLWSVVQLRKEWDIPLQEIQIHRCRNISDRWITDIQGASVSVTRED